MQIVRPPADIARYTMVFHKRDSGNEINKDRSVVGHDCVWTTISLFPLIDLCAPPPPIPLPLIQDKAVETNGTSLEKRRTEQLQISDLISGEAAALYQRDRRHREAVGPTVSNKLGSLRCHFESVE